LGWEKSKRSPNGEIIIFWEQYKENIVGIKKIFWQLAFKFGYEIVSGWDNETFSEAWAALAVFEDDEKEAIENAKEGK
jgi:hypothetical protein